MKTVTLKTTNGMSNRQYHLAGKPKWWVRIGEGANAQFIKIDDIRGDTPLEVTVDIPKHITTIYVGVGSKDKGIRHTITIS